ncbi:hypothetical protein WR25_08912 [Diploscapter pachys]|uniref:Ral GTPase-activating protein subunit alpha/beta N-terminal domain-containing protein n=1 Tax=Diploscapter pachys TaxID=2018661 RepID=A0A2A2KMV4_9BILA|nr:hypothetical protein WR25_08912 [Diploscapter pachys]
MSVFRKTKSADLQASLAKFTDMSKDCVSRVKHLKLLLDGLSVHEKRQLIDEHSFETFHLVDELLLCTELDSNSPAALEAESGLWALEQVLCFAPELVGSGWQQHAIESLLKKALYPKNVLAVRKIAIRLFLIFYQSLGVCNHNMPHLDRVFQCLLPHLPLSDGSNTETVIGEYCQSASTPSAAQLSAVHHTSVSSADMSSAPTAKERAQLLQIYLDKFLEYCTRECSRIEWNDESKKLECAKFIISKVIDLYICESFPDLEVNGVDVFGGWEGEGQAAIALDTADPVVIARYWLIRWINNIAGARLTAGPAQHAGLKLFHQALFSSHKATNVMLTLLREAMTLPLPCSNVMHKVVNVLSSWLLQIEIPPFVESGQVSMETFSLLVVHTLLAFFHSPYLQQPAERLPSALSLSFVILRQIRQLATHRLHLPMPITSRVWSEIIGHLCAAAKQVLSHNDVYSQQVSGPIINTLLTLIVVVKAVRRVTVDDKLWDELYALFESRPLPQLVEQWAIVNRSVTRALILHLTHIEIFPKEELDKCMNDHETNKSLVERQSNAEKADEELESQLLPALQFDDITHAVPSWSGDPSVWLAVWRRLVCLCPVASPLVAETLSHTIQALLTVNLVPLAHWLSARLLTLPPPLLSQAVGALASVCHSARSTESARLLHAHILAAMGQLVQTRDENVLEQICLLNPSELNVLRKSLVPILPNLPPSIHSIRIAYFMASDPIGSQYLHKCLTANLPLPLSLATSNALTMLLIQKADVKEINTLLAAILPHPHASSLLLIFLTSLLSLCRFGCQTAVLQAFLRVSSNVKDSRLQVEIQWLLVSLCLSHLHTHLPVVTVEILKERQKVLQGDLKKKSKLNNVLKNNFKNEVKNLVRISKIPKFRQAGESSCNSCIRNRTGNHFLPYHIYSISKATMLSCNNSFQMDQIIIFRNAPVNGRSVSTSLIRCNQMEFARS